MKGWGTRGPQDEGTILAASSALALGVTAMLLLTRAPSTSEFILPRRIGFGVIDFFIQAQHSPGLRSAVSWLSLGLILAAGAAIAIRLWTRLRGSRRTHKVRLALAALLLLAAARFSVSLMLDILGNVWGAPGGIGLSEAILAFLWVLAAGQALGHGLLAAARWNVETQGRRKWARRVAVAASVLLIPGGCLYAYAALRLDWRKASLSEAAGIPENPKDFRTIIILKETDTPDYEVRRVGVGVEGQADYSRESLRRLEEFVGRGRTLFTREALRHIYGGYTVRMEADRLRESLFMAHRAGDTLARLLLISNLAHAPVEKVNLRFLDDVSDEEIYRVGARGAALLALAYSQQGDHDRASYWGARASSGSGGIPRGLLGITLENIPAATLKGKVKSPEPVQLGLYARVSPGAPYGLAPSELVASTRTGEEGRFEFVNLAPGDYYLALVLESGEAEVGLSVHQGDIRIEGKTVDLKTLVIKRL